MALYSWANLNHTLCGTSSDPFWAIFNLGKWYWILAEIYLGAASFAAFLANSAICYVVKRIICGDKSQVQTDPKLDETEKSK